MSSKQLTKTQMILQTSCPYKNPYQGSDWRVLFVCSAGLLRSATGSRIYAKKFNTRAAGSESYALVPVSASLLLWADEVVFVNEENYIKVKDNFDLDALVNDGLVVTVLDIPDKYDHMHPELVQSFIEQFGELE